MHPITLSLQLFRENWRKYIFGFNFYSFTDFFWPTNILTGSFAVRTNILTHCLFAAIIYSRFLSSNKFFQLLFGVSQTKQTTNSVLHNKIIYKHLILFKKTAGPTLLFYIIVHLYMYCENSSFLLELITDSNTLTLNTTIYNNGHILRVFDTIPKIFFTRNEAKHDY